MYAYRLHAKRLFLIDFLDFSVFAFEVWTKDFVAIGPLVFRSHFGEAFKDFSKECGLKIDLATQRCNLVVCEPEKRSTTSSRVIGT